MEPQRLDVVANQLPHRVLLWDGGGPRSVVCLHGFLDLSWDWQRVAIPLVRAGLRVFAPDLRGHGDTARIGPGGYYHFFDYLLDLIELLPALGLNRPLLVGHSMGGAIAAYFAGSFPEAVERVAVLEGFATREESFAQMPQRIAQWATAVRRARARSPRVYPTRAAAAQRLRDIDPRLDAEFAAFLAAHGTRPAEGGDGYVFKHDPLHLTRGPMPFRLDYARPLWEAITCPTLLMEASHSELLPNVPDHAARRASFRHARHVVIADAGHMLIRHQPERVAAALIEFFNAPASTF